MLIQPGSDLEHIIFEYLHCYTQLPEEDISSLTEGMPPYNATPVDIDDQKYRACLWASYQQSLREAQRLGYQEHPEAVIWPMGRPAVVLEVIKPDKIEGATTYPNFSLIGFEDRVVAAAQPYGLLVDPFDYHDPDLMWDLIISRRDGDAVIFLAGDDRDYTHIIGIVWSPIRLQRGDIPHAII